MVREDDLIVKGDFSSCPIGVANGEGIVLFGENQEVADAQNKGTQNKCRSSTCAIHTLKRVVSQHVEFNPAW